MKICPKCGSENKDEAKFCNECGGSLNVKEVNSDEAPLQDSGELKNISILKSQTESVEKAPRKNIAIVCAVAILLCLIIFVTKRPKLESLEISYNGNTEEGITLDNENEGFKVVAIYSDGKKKEVPLGEWEVSDPQTLEADNSCNVTISYKNAKQDVNIKCSTTKLQYITATYNGPSYEGITIDENSDIEVIATYGNGQTQNVRTWSLDPQTITLVKDKTSKVSVIVKTTEGDKFSTELSILGKEKPIANINNEGLQYNCSAEQFISYLEYYGLCNVVSTTNKYFSDNYKSYYVTPPSSAEINPFYMGIQENSKGKMNVVAFAYTGTNPVTGLNESVWLARKIDITVHKIRDEWDESMFNITKMHGTEDAWIQCEENKFSDGYVYYIMPYDYIMSDPKGY